MKNEGGSVRKWWGNGKKMCKSGWKMEKWRKMRGKMQKKEGSVEKCGGKKMVEMEENVGKLREKEGMKWWRRREWGKHGRMLENEMFITKEKRT